MYSPPPRRRLVSPPPPGRRLVSPPPDHHRYRYPRDVDYHDDVEDEDDDYEEDENDDNDHGNDHGNDSHDNGDDDVHHDNHSNNRHRRHHNGHHKQRNSRSSFSMDLLRTAVTTLGDAVVNGREDGQRHMHNRQRHEEYDPQSLNPWGNKTADQVYETLVQAAYTLGEVVGDLEHKLGVDPDEARESRDRQRKSKHRGVEDEYDKWGHNMPRGYADEYYNQPPQHRPNPLHRQSSNPELEPSYHQYQHDPNDSYHSSNSSKSSVSNKLSKRHKHTGSTPPPSNEEGPSKSMGKAILHQLPGLLTRAAFILELWELKQHSKDRKSMAGKYAMMLMAVKIIEQLGQEYVCYRHRSSKKR